LPHLIGLCLALVVLDVDAWITYPGRFEDGMACAHLARFSKEFLTHFLELTEPNIGWFTSHLVEDFLGRHYKYPVSIMAPIRKQTKQWQHLLTPPQFGCPVMPAQAGIQKTSGARLLPG
jgi:hypothetical protein